MTAIRTRALSTIVLGTVSSVGRASYGQGRVPRGGKGYYVQVSICIVAFLPICLSLANLAMLATVTFFVVKKQYSHVLRGKETI